MRRGRGTPSSRWRQRPFSRKLGQGPSKRCSASTRSWLLVPGKGVGRRRQGPGKHEEGEADDRGSSAKSRETRVFDDMCSSQDESRVQQRNLVEKCVEPGLVLGPLAEGIGGRDGVAHLEGAGGVGGAEDVVTADGSGRPDKHGGRHGNLDGEGESMPTRRMQRSRCGTVCVAGVTTALERMQAESRFMAGTEKIGGGIDCDDAEPKPPC